MLPCKNITCGERTVTRNENDYKCTTYNETTKYRTLKLGLATA